MRSRTDPEPSILWLDEVDSTNAYVVTHIEALSHATFVVAERQSAGVGRSGRGWHSPPGGNVYMTGVLKHFPGAGWSPGGLTLTMGLAVCDALDRFGVRGALKWPNDVRVDGEKIAGVLARAVWMGNHLVGVALGVGVNVNMGADDLGQIDQPATSLLGVIGRPVDARRVAQSVASRFLDRWDAYDPTTLRCEAIERADYLGRAVAVRTPLGEIVGRAVDLDPSFHLVVEDEGGVRHAVQAGDVGCS